MNIVVVDGHTLNPGDLTWDGLAALGSCEVHERTEAEKTVARCREADIVVTNKVVLDQPVLSALPELKLIAVTATGYNVVDIVAASERGVIVSNVPVYGTASVAQMVFALLLELTQHVGEHSRSVREGKWCAAENFCYWDYPLIELQGMTMGVVGCGRIGRATAALAQAFGMDVIGYDTQAEGLSALGIEPVDLDTLLTRSDVVSLHCPLFPETERMINADTLARMKSTAFLINTSRGPLVDEPALAAALKAGALAGAAVDVLSAEPPPADHPLFSARNCIVTPHIAWATHSARERLMQTTVENVAAFIQGTPMNVVS